MRKALIAVTVASALFAVGALAANLSVQSDNVASGEAAVTACGEAEVEWTVSDARDDTTGDWVVETALVTFDNTACNGAEVDLAIGINTGGTADVDSWIQADDCTGSGPTYTCTPDSEPPVAQVVDVAVLANGNSVPATTDL